VSDLKNAATVSGAVMGTLLDDPSLANSHPCSNLSKLLSTGAFYFSRNSDLTRPARIRSKQASNSTSQSTGGIDLLSNSDPHFVWNNHLLAQLAEVCDADLDQKSRVTIKDSLLVVLVHGFVGIEQIYLDARDGRRHNGQLAIISRLSCKRSGTRYNARGIDDEGNVSNFVEVFLFFFLKLYHLAYRQAKVLTFRRNSYYQMEKFSAVFFKFVEAVCVC
jgi:hypothetical protein